MGAALQREVIFGHRSNATIAVAESSEYAKHFVTGVQSTFLISNCSISAISPKIF